jgi:proline racemase
MQFSKYFTTIDSHTCGDPTRTVTGGVGPIPGKTISEKMLYLKENRDEIRQLLMFEPRGNEVQSGVILTEPCTPGADIGVIYIEVGGYLTMCGHDTIGVATALVESGMVQPVEPYTDIKLDTPIGIVEVRVKVEAGHAIEVGFVNQPSFIFAEDVQIEVPDVGAISLDISFGGLFYAILDAADVGLTVGPKYTKQAITIGRAIREAVNRRIDVQHPTERFIKGVTHVLFTAPPQRHPDAHLSNAVVIPPGSVSRSPCGTGTCAKVAQLYKHGQLKVDDIFNHESAMTGTIFKARVAGTDDVGDYDAVVVDVTGSAHITGMHTFVVDPRDPLRNGFSLL